MVNSGIVYPLLCLYEKMKSWHPRRYVYLKKEKKKSLNFRDLTLCPSFTVYKSKTPNSSWSLLFPTTYDLHRGNGSLFFSLTSWGGNDFTILFLWGPATLSKKKWITTGWQGHKTKPFSFTNLLCCPICFMGLVLL